METCMSFCGYIYYVYYISDVSELIEHQLYSYPALLREWQNSSKKNCFVYIEYVLYKRFYLVFVLLYRL